MAEPESGADRALENGEAGNAEIATRQTASLCTGRTVLRGRLTRSALRVESRGAVMAIARPVGNACCAGRADRVKVALMHREIGTTVVARFGGALAGGTTRRAPHHRRLVGLRFRDCQCGAAKAAETITFRFASRIALAFAGRAGDQEAHHLV